MLYPSPDKKKMCSFPSLLLLLLFFFLFLLLSFQSAKSNIKGVKNTTTVPVIVTSVVGQVCQFLYLGKTIKSNTSTSCVLIFMGLLRDEKKCLLFCLHFIYLFLRLKFITSRNPSPRAIVSSYIFCFCCLHFYFFRSSQCV